MSSKEWAIQDVEIEDIKLFKKDLRIEIKLRQMRGFCEDCNRTSISKVDWIHPKFESIDGGDHVRRSKPHNVFIVKIDMGT